MPRLVRDRVTWLAYLALVFYVYVINGVGPSLPGLQADLGLDYTQTSLHGTVFALGFVLLGLVGDRVIRRLGRRRALWLGFLAAQGGAILLAAAPSLAVSLPAMLLIGAVGGFVLVLPSGILADRHGPARGRALGEANALASTSAAVSPLLIGAAIGAGASWRIGLVLPPALLAAGIVLALGPQRIDPGRLIRLRASDPASTDEPSGNEPPEVAALRLEAPPTQQQRLPSLYWRHWSTMVFVVAVEWCLVYWIAAYLQSALGVEEATAAASVSGFLGGMVVGRLVGARLVGPIRPERLLLAYLAIAGVGFGLFWSAPALPLALVGIVVAGLGVAMLFPLALELMLETAPAAIDLATTRAALGSGVAIGSGPFILGFLADSVGLRAAYLVVPVFGVLAVLNVVRTERARRTLAQGG